MSRAYVDDGMFGSTASNTGNAYSMHGPGRVEHSGLTTQYSDAACAAQDNMLMYRQPILQSNQLAAGGAISVPTMSTGSASGEWISPGVAGSLDGSQPVRLLYRGVQSFWESPPG